MTSGSATMSLTKILIFPENIALENCEKEVFFDSKGIYFENDISKHYLQLTISLLAAKASAICGVLFSWKVRRSHRAQNKIGLCDRTPQ